VKGRVWREPSRDMVKKVQEFGLPRSSPEIVNLCGLCPVHSPT
jgi:hypothetical protein